MTGRSKKKKQTHRRKTAKESTIQGWNSKFPIITPKLQQASAEMASF